MFNRDGGAMSCRAEELLLINSVGQRKLARFGEAFMTLIRAHLAGIE